MGLAGVNSIPQNQTLLQNTNIIEKEHIKNYTKNLKNYLQEDSANLNSNLLVLTLSNIHLEVNNLLFLKTIINGEIEQKSLLDSGASHNFISIEFIKKNKLQNQIFPLTRSVIINAANGENIQCLGTFTTTVEFELKDEKHYEEVQFYVLDKLVHKVIFGVPFMIKFGELIPWSNLSKDEQEISYTIQEEEQYELPAYENEDNETELEYYTADEMEEEEIMNEKNEESTRLNLNIITTERQLKRNVNNKENAILMGYIYSIENDNEKKEEENGIEKPYANTEELRNKLYNEFSNTITNDPPMHLPPKRNLTHRIILIEPNKNVYRKQYKLSHQEKIELNKQVEALLAQGFVRPSASPFNSPVLFVKKKDGTMRLCIDYRILNNNTVKDKFPIPRIDEIISKFGKAKVFSKLDLMSGYFQVRINDEDMEKTAFSTEFGHFEWVVMPFGLTNAPSTFQRMMNEVLGPYLGKFVQVYLDDIIIYSPSIETHYQHLREVLNTLKQNKLVAKRKKCSLFYQSLQFLGHVISNKGVHVDPTKIDKINEWPIPTTVKEAQSFIGLSGYYRRFIANYSKIAAPIFNFITGKSKWEKSQQDAFDELKRSLTNAPVLVHPIWDEGYKFVVHSDACGSALGYVLEQVDPNGKTRGVIAYGSKKLVGSQLNYSIYDREFMAVVEALHTWRYYLLNRHFILKTDHKSLIYLKNQNLIDSTRVARWLDYLSQYDFSIEYIQGRKNSVADALSRYPYKVSANNLFITQVESVVAPNEELKEEIIKGYSKDEELSEIYDVLQNNLPVPKTINNYIKHYRLHDKLLYFTTVPGDISNRIAIPNNSELIRKLIKNAHDLPSAGHFGFYKTYERLHGMFYWPHMLKSVKNFCQRCLLCQQSKAETHGKKGLFSPLPIPPGRWTDITLDFITGIPPSRSGYDMILVVVDRFSKMAHFIPTVKTLNGIGCARLLVDNCFKYHGIPRRMVSDKDIRFTSEFWHTVNKLFGTSVLFSTTNHPQTDGQTERTNRILNELLRNYTNNDIFEWDKWLSVAEFAYNSSHQLSIGMSPFELCYGYLPDSPSTMQGYSIHDLRYDDKAARFAKRMKLIIKQVQDNLVKSQHQQEVHHNKHRSEINFKVGDWILLHKDAHGHDSKYYKIQPVYYGPFKLVKQIGSNAFEVDLPSMNKKDRVMNVKWFRKFLQADSGFPKVPPRTLAEAESRLHEIIGIAGIDETNNSLDVYWRDCDPCHSSSIPVELFTKLPESEQATLWNRARALDPKNHPSEIQNNSQHENLNFITSRTKFPGKRGNVNERLRRLPSFLIRKY